MSMSYRNFDNRKFDGKNNNNRNHDNNNNDDDLSAYLSADDEPTNINGNIENDDDISLDQDGDDENAGRLLAGVPMRRTTAMRNANTNSNRSTSTSRPKLRFHESAIDQAKSSHRSALVAASAPASLATTTTAKGPLAVPSAKKYTGHTDVAALRKKNKKKPPSTSHVSIGSGSGIGISSNSSGILGFPSAHSLATPKSSSSDVQSPFNVNSHCLDNTPELTAAEIYGDGVGLGADPSKGRSVRKNNPLRQRSSGDSGPLLEKEAVLANLEENADCMAAAASVVKYGTNTLPSKTIKPGDHVLVSIAILDAVSMNARGGDHHHHHHRGEGNGSSRPHKSRTRAPVNKYGFPKGKGNKEAEKKGPYLYVLCEVLSVHFGADAREYTVKRFDTETEQRADRGEMFWIEKNCRGHEAAMAAAKHTPSPEREAGNGSTNFFDNKCFHAMSKFCKTGSTASKDFLKDHATRCLSGQAPYRMEVKFTTVNLLVVCAIIVAFLEQIKHMFEATRFDDVMSYVVLAATVVLILELLLEVCNRPENFSELLKHEDAYSPTTVRYINRFHLVFESIALAGVIVELLPSLLKKEDRTWTFFTFGAINATCGRSYGLMIAGHAYFVLVRLRLFNLVRHVRNFWIKSYESDNSSTNETQLARRTTRPGDRNADMASSKEDATLRKAGTIGTALMLVNSERAMILLLLITAAVPIFTAMSNGGRNETIFNMTSYLHSINKDIIGNNPDANSCTIGRITVESWLKAEKFVWEQSRFPNHDTPKVVLALLKDSSNGTDRCQGEKENFKTVWCDEDQIDQINCTSWANNNPTLYELEVELKVRHGYLVNVTRGNESDICTTVVYNASEAIARTAFNSFMLQLSMLVIAILTIGLLRSDANKLVITPLRRMLKIVLRYAENPLDELDVEIDRDGGNDKLGSYETEQLITAVTKITDLLRKCWGVAGAGIISSNLARNMNGKNKMVFNPTVPGKNVYAIFGFAGINDFSNLLRSLDKDVMDLINDIAQVVHNEVFRWGSADKGQCNKNLGACFLMVYRIGDFDEVRERMRNARAEIFQETQPESSKTDLTIHLAQLPGIAAFADRALLGLLKTFAGINRERCVKDWENNFSLTNGVGKHPIQMSFGMDAAWAVEGAVGSTYKIDATYLSPHVNMASRMMCACKQYKLTILMSQAVEELLSREARECVRHVDTVFVKGSKLKQRIFTYDARHEGVDFFLNKRSDKDADNEANKYAPSIWNTDQDLLEMRSHISPNFRSTFQRGLDQYLMGNFAEAANTLKEADWLMIETVVADGRQENVNAISDQLLDRNINHVEVMHLRKKLGDGPSQAIVEYIKSENYKKPDKWDGVRQLEKK